MKAGKCIYIPIPEQLKDRFSGLKSFVFNPSIPLPVELPPEYPDGGQFNTSELTEEMILAGILLDVSENPDGANSAYYRSLITAVKPKLAAELQEAAVIKSKSGDYTSALEIFRLLEGILGGRQDPYLLLDRALVLEEAAAAKENSDPAFSEAAYKKVEAAYEKALACPAPDTLFYAGLFYEKRGDYLKASDCLAAYLEAEVEEEETLYTIQAREVLNEIRNSGLEDAAFMDSLTLIRKGDTEQGILKAREFLERQPGAGKGWFVLGWGLRLLSRWQDATACFEKAIELGCANADTLNEMALCSMETGNEEQARRELEKALRLDPENVKIISNMGILAMKQNDTEKAASFFRTVLELDPEDTIALAYFKRNDT
jgi:tetratricopeptide (TPR) repeat protein